MSSRSPYEIHLTDEERMLLEGISRRRTASYREVVRARIVLMAAAGVNNAEIAARLDMPREVVSRWRKRFFDQGLAGLEERMRTGRPVRFSPRLGRGFKGF